MVERALPKDRPNTHGIKTESAGGVVVNKQGSILVVSQGGADFRSWSLPKGHVEEGETKLDTALREIKEETGIDQLELVKPLGSYQRYKIGRGGVDVKSELKTIFMFLFKTEQEKIKPIDPDNPEARWVPKGEVVGLLTAEKDKEFFSSIMDKI